MANSLRGNGAGVGFLRLLVGYTNQTCVTWPFKRLPNGYGMLGYLGDTLYAHRLMCQLAHGDPPTPDHIAAHSCGRGHEGCVNPNHLSWKTYSENELDKRVHGTTRNPWWGKKGKLTRDEVKSIRALEGKKTQAELATLFSISEPTIRDILHRRTWQNV